MKCTPFFLICLGLFSGAVHAQTIEQKKQPSYQANLHYQILNPGLQPDSEQAVVYEFFSYMCPGCFKFEPIMKNLKAQLKPEQKIIRVPVVFHAQWRPHAQTYYALVSMGELSRVHDALFNAIHQQRLPLRTLDDIAQWLSDSFQVDSQAFLTTAKSFQVDSQMRKAAQMAKTLGVNGIPRLVVNGKYQPDFDQLKSAPQIIDVTKYLLIQ